MKMLTLTMEQIETALPIKSMGAATTLANIWRTTNTLYHDHQIWALVIIAPIDPMVIITAHGHICPRYMSEMVVRAVRHVQCHRSVHGSQLVNLSVVGPCLSKIHCSILFSLCEKKITIIT